MGWLCLCVAGLLEAGWPLATKYAWAPDGLRVGPATAAVGLMLASTGFLLVAQRTIPIGTAYVVWTGIGSVGTVVVGVAVLREPAAASRIFFLALVVLGVIGLKLTAAPR